MKIILSLLLVLIGITAFSASFWVDKTDPTDIKTFTVTRTDLNTSLLLSGSVVNEQVVVMTALLNGQLLEVAANEGDIVEKGAVLARIDDRLSNALLEKNQATQAAAERQLEASRKVLERTQRLFDSGNSSEQLLQDAFYEVQRLEAVLKARRADTKIARLNAENTIIRSPFAALVTESSAGVGQWVEAGTQLFKLAASDGLAVEAFVNEADLGRVVLGQPVTLSSNAWPDKTWQSETAWIAPAIADDKNAPPDSFAIRLLIGDAAPALLLGQDVDVNLRLASRTNVLSLPLTAMVEGDNGQFFVWREDSQGPTKQAVSTGLSTIDTIEIIDGLNEGDTIIAPEDAERASATATAP